MTALGSKPISFTNTAWSMKKTDWSNPKKSPKREKTYALTSTTPILLNYSTFLAETKPKTASPNLCRTSTEKPVTLKPSTRSMGNWSNSRLTTKTWLGARVPDSSQPLNPQAMTSMPLKTFATDKSIPYSPLCLLLWSLPLMKLQLPHCPVCCHPFRLG